MAYMTDELDSKCEKCRFFEDTGVVDCGGHCHRYPPKPIPKYYEVTVEDGYMPNYFEIPWVDPNEFCGEFVSAQ